MIARLWAVTRLAWAASCLCGCTNGHWTASHADTVARARPPAAGAVAAPADASPDAVEAEAPAAVSGGSSLDAGENNSGMTRDGVPSQ
jgi:hypothetical protein